MQFIITDEDRKFADLIVERFDPGKVMKKPAGLSDEDWAIFIEPHRHELRNEIKAMQIASALQSAGLLSEVDEEAIQHVSHLCGLDRSMIEDTDEWLRVNESLNVDHDPISKNFDRALNAVREAV